jgi:hypothetical protein
MSFTTETVSEVDAHEAPESPFLHSELRNGAAVAPLEAPLSELSPAAESPFTTGELPAGTDGGTAGNVHELLAELYDSEFDRALFELSEAAAEAAESRPFVQGEVATGEAERFVREWLEPLHRDAHAMLEAIGETFAQTDVAQLTEQELEELMAEHEPQPSGENPVFENFLGGLFRKARAALSGAVRLAKKGIAAVGSLIPIGPILEKLKALVRPLLERVLQLALDRLPPVLRPAAEQLKDRLLGVHHDPAPSPPTPPPATAAPTTGDVGAVQHEFDTNVASLLLARDETDRDTIVAQAHEAAVPGPDSVRELNEARERFAEELRTLPPGGDPGPAMENFLPAVLPFLKLGISLIGRNRVINFLARYLAPLIRPYVGDQAPALSQAIASSGLSLISLEAPPDPHEVSAHALAGTVEDTIHRLAEAGGAAFEDEHLLEAATASAFNEAVAANFPPALVRPEHREVSVGGPTMSEAEVPGLGMWILRRHHNHAHRRYTRVLRAWITPNIARHVVVFGGTPLADFLRDHYSITTDVSVPVHLFEAMPGASLMRIAHAEPEGIGLGHGHAYWKLHPLTHEAAGLLLGEPELGRTVDHRYLATPERICVGQRFYQLELPERRMHIGRRMLHLSHVNVTVNFPKEHVRIGVHLTEADAQRVAAALRTSNLVAAVQILASIIRPGLHTALSPNPLGHLRWVDGTATGQAALVSLFGNTARALGVTPDQVRRHLAHEIRHAVLSAIKGYLHGRSGEFIAAADRHKHGLTLVVRLRHPVGLAQLRSLYHGEKVAGLQSLRGLFPQGGHSSVVEVRAGRHHG